MFDKNPVFYDKINENFIKDYKIICYEKDKKDFNEFINDWKN